jgi:hypothetical protein
MTKGRYVAFVPMEGIHPKTKVNEPDPLTVEALKAAMVSARDVPGVARSFFGTGWEPSLVEPSPFERGVLDRFQDGRRR